MESRNVDMTIKHSNFNRGISSLRVEPFAGQLGEVALELVKPAFTIAVFPSLIAADHRMSMAKGARFRSML